METDSYTFTETQLILLNASVNAWRGSSFWALMYMQSRLFDAENADSIYQELQAQPAHYDQIMERYYGVSLTSGAAADGSPLYHYYDTYLEHLKQRQRRQAEQIRQQWLELNRLTAQRLAELNPHWESSLWGSMFTHNTNLLCQAADDPQDLPGQLRVQRRGRLIKAENIRMHRQRPGDGHPLLLPAGELMRIEVPLLRQADFFEKLHRIAPDLV